MPGLLRRWNALAPRERLLAAAVVAVLLALASFAAFGRSDARVSLFAAPLRPDQLSEVVERLAEWNEAFVVAADGVRVDAKRRNDVLLRLSMAGVPHAHLPTTAEMFEKAGPLTPQSVLDAQARDGLAGDLASALRRLPGVDDARVIIAPGRDGAFSDEASHPATASVKLDLKAGAVPSRAMLDGVRQFVASGVAGLDAAHVAVLDDRGLALGDAAAASNRDDAAALQASLQSALDLALGPGSAIVRVRVTYDARRRENRSTVRRPAGNDAIGTTTSDERYASASKKYAKTSRAVDRGSVVDDERVETPAGLVDRISVAVAVDQARAPDLAKIRALAAATLGLVPARGDTVSVEAIAFPRAPVAARRFRFAALAGLAAALAPTLALAAVGVAALRFGAQPAAAVVQTLVQRVALARTAREVAGFPPAHVRGALQDEPPHAAAAIISALPAATATAVLELYPPEERAAIVRRMSRQAAPAVPDCESVLRRG